VTVEDPSGSIGDTLEIAVLRLEIALNPIRKTPAGRHERILVKDS
jgi:hypothetical protein